MSNERQTVACASVLVFVPLHVLRTLLLWLVPMFYLNLISYPLQLLLPQIPSCTERDSALSQLAAQGETPCTDLVALNFRVRPSTCKGAPFSSTPVEVKPVTVSAERAGDVTVKNETAVLASERNVEAALASEFGVGQFFTSCGPLKAKGASTGDLDFSVRAPTTSKNLFRVLRALQVIFSRLCLCVPTFFFSWFVARP